MFGWKSIWPPDVGGTFANLEALMAGSCGGTANCGSEQAHYTHTDQQRAEAEFTGWRGRARRMRLDALKTSCAKATWARCGNAGRRQWRRGSWRKFWRSRALWRAVHVDAAMRYFGLISDTLDEPAQRAYAAIAVPTHRIDPHKHGCNIWLRCVLFAIRQWVGFTNIRRTRISLRLSCIWRD